MNKFILFSWNSSRNSKKIWVFNQFKEFKTLTSERFTMTLKPEVEEELERKTMKLRKHPGRRTTLAVTLPDRLVAAANQVLLNYPLNKELKEKTTRISNILRERHLPPENRDIQTTTWRLYREVIANVPAPNGKQESELDPGEKEHLNDKRKEYLIKKIKTILHRWKPVEYNKEISILYLLARLVPNYACIQRALQEIVAEDPQFTPTNVLDFASGLATTLWACHERWGDNIKEFLCVDVSNEMNELAQQLLQDGYKKRQIWKQGVFFKRYLSPVHKVKYDLVVSAHALLDLPNQRMRLQTVDNLWQKTSNYLVLIENGSNSGYKAILEARDYILKIEKKQAKKMGLPFPDVHVFAPCTHSMACPRISDNSGTPCNFRVKYFNFLTNWYEDTSSVLFSFIIMKRGPSNKCDERKEWPRIVRDVMKRKGHVMCNLCCSDGTLKEIIFTKKYNGKELFQCARSSEWGDKIPGKLIHTRDYLEDPNPKAKLKILNKLAASPPVPSLPSTTEEEDTSQQEDLGIDTNNIPPEYEDSIRELQAIHEEILQQQGESVQDISSETSHFHTSPESDKT